MDNLATELIKAQEVERQARAVYLDAHARMVSAQGIVREIETEIANRSFADAGVVMGKTVVSLKNRPGDEMLAVGVSGGTLMVRRQTRKGGWFKNAEPLHRVGALDIVIVRQEGDGK